MSRSELHNWECAIEELSGDNADKMLIIAQDIYNTAFVRGKNYMSWEQEPKRGKWIYDGDCIICNKCLKAFGWISMNMVSNFCPNCGADMRGSDSE